MPRKRRTWKPKPDQTHTRKGRQARGAGGKFIKLPETTLQDIRRFLAHEGEECLRKRPETMIGREKGNVWYRRKEGGELRRVVEELWEEKVGRKLEKGERLRRKCKTAGCMNEEHYELVTEEKMRMVNDEQARGFYEKAMRDGEARLPVGDATQAKRLRMNIYARRGKWKTGDPGFYFTVESYGLFIENGDLVCRKHGEDLDTLFTAAGVELTGDRKPQEVVEREIRTRLEEVKKEEQGDVLRDLGYAPERSLGNGRREIPGNSIGAPTFNEVYSKVIRGEKLTEGEEEILNAGAKD